MAKEGKKVKLIKLIRELSPAQFGWGLKLSKKFVDIMFPDISANKRNTKDTNLYVHWK